MSAPRSPQEPARPPSATPEEAVGEAPEPITGDEPAAGAEDVVPAADADDVPAGDADAGPTADDAESPAAAGPTVRVVDVADPSRVRRAPRYGRFAFAGLLLAVVVSFGLTFVPGAETGLTRRNLFFLLLLGLGSLGILLGLLVALWTDRRSLRRRR